MKNMAKGLEWQNQEKKRSINLEKTLAMWKS
jgi:hypothetical protein